MESLFLISLVHLSLFCTCSTLSFFFCRSFFQPIFPPKPCPASSVSDLYFHHSASKIIFLSSHHMPNPTIMPFLHFRISVTFTDFLITLFLILFGFVTSHIQRSILISASSILHSPCFTSVQHCWPHCCSVHLHLQRYGASVTSQWFGEGPVGWAESEFPSKLLN